MSVSTDAVFAYGYDLGELVELDWFGEDDDFIEKAHQRLLEAHGFTETWKEHRDGYYRRRTAAEQDMGVEILSHCSVDYPQYLLAAYGTATTASRGNPRVITRLDPPPGAQQKLSWALGVLQLEPPQDKPAWWLASDTDYS